ncbi:MAG: hypothetical protein LUH04_08520 [Clostridium sp.]|nr:hypothetical protein [Clostridium sp.]
MKKSKQLTVAAAALLVLCAAYAGLAWQQKRSAERALSESENSRIYVTDFTDVTGIAIENGDSRLDFVLDGGTWYYAKDHDCPIAHKSGRPADGTPGHAQAGVRG